MHDLSTGALHEMDANGVTLSSGPFGGRWGSQSAFGLWTFSENGQLVARLSLPLNEARSFFTYLGDVGTGQKADRRKDDYPTPESAVLEAMDYAYVLSVAVQKEYGGLICAKGTKFEWSDIVTDNSQSSVNVPDTLCPAGTLRAHFHTHPPIEQSAAPTDPNDYQNADLHPGIPYYIIGPWPNAPGHVLRVKYWNGSGRSAKENLCYLSDGNWLPYVANSGAVCATP